MEAVLGYLAPSVLGTAVPAGLLHGPSEVVHV